MWLRLDLEFSCDKLVGRMLRCRALGSGIQKIDPLASSKVTSMPQDHTSIEVIEKRRFLRLSDYFKVGFQPAGEFGEKKDDSTEEVGFSKNLSLGGVAFVTEAEVSTSDYIRATIQIPEIDGLIEVVGQVIRVMPRPEGKSEVALKFLPFGIDEDQRNKLELFIYDHFLKDPLA